MTTSIQNQNFVNFLTTIKSSRLTSRQTLAPISYFMMGYACAARLETSKNLNPLIEAFYMLKRLEDLQSFDESWRRKALVPILMNPTMKVEKELNHLLTQSSFQGEVYPENPEEFDAKAVTYDEIYNAIASRNESLDMILLGFICMRQLDSWSKIAEKAAYIHETRTTEAFTEDQIAQLFEALYSSIDTDLKALVTTIKESAQAKPVEEVAVVEQKEEKTEQAEQVKEEVSVPVATVERQFECKICLETSTEAGQFHTIQVCSHVFHKSCVKEYIQTQMTDQKMPVLCPGDECKAEFCDFDLKQVLTSEEIKKFYEMTMAHYISKNRLVAFQCPSPDCPYKLFELEAGATEVTCPVCWRATCLKCNEEVHYDTPCELNQFVKAAVNLGLKACPSCRLWVEKIEGCNHMTCSCGHEFCYNCGRVYGALMDETEGYSICGEGLCEEVNYYDTMKDLLKLQEVQDEE